MEKRETSRQLGGETGREREGGRQRESDASQPPRRAGRGG